MEIEFNACPDADLVTAFADSQNQGAFEELVRRYGAMVMNTCRRIAITEEDAEDAFQATFLALAEKSRKIRRPSSVAAWLHQTAIQTVNAMHRKAIREERHLHRVGQAMQEFAARKQQLQELRALVDAEIGRLPKRLQLALVLCDLEGLTRRVAGERLGVPSATVASHVTKARELLSRRLSKRGVLFSVSALAVAMQELGGAPVNAALVSETLVKSLEQTRGGTSPSFGDSSGQSTAVRGIFSIRTVAPIAVVCIGILLAWAWNADNFNGDAPSVVSMQSATLPRVVSDQEGDSNLFNRIPDQPAAFRVQQLHESVEFPPGQHLLMGMSWRPDGDVVAGRNVTIDQLSVVLSTTQASPGDGLSSNMAENHGPNATIVHAAPFTFKSRDYHGLPNGPRAFDYSIRFDEPFAYDSCYGNLLVDISLYLPGMPAETLPPRVDAQSHAEVHAVVATKNTGDLADIREHRVIVTQFDFAPQAAAPENRGPPIVSRIGK